MLCDYGAAAGLLAEKGSVPEYTGGTDPLVYLVTTADRLVEFGLPMLGDVGSF